jgi:hypothetical protein
MKTKITPLKIGLIGTFCTYFTGDKTSQYAESIAALEALAEPLGFELYPVREGLYDHEDGQAAARILVEKDLDFMLVQASAFSLGEYAHVFADLGAPLGLWAVPEGTMEHGAGLPLNSFTAMNMYNSTLGLYRHDYQAPVKWFYGRPDNPLFRERFEITVAALRAKANLNGATLGLVGGVAPGFHNLIVDERDLKNKLGVNLVSIELDPLMELAKGYSNAQVAEAAATIRADAASFEAGMEPALLNSARVYLASLEIADRYGFDALALSTWPRFQTDMELAVETVLGRLNDDGLPTANEGDVYAASSMLALHYLSAGEVTTLMDLSDFDENDQSALFWHDGPTAPSMADERGVRMQHLWTFDSYNPEGIGLHNDLVMKSGPATVMAFTRNFERMLALSGQMNSEKPSWMGSRGWMQKIRMADEPVSVSELIETLMSSQMQHHYPLVYGRHEAASLELAAWLGISPIRKQHYSPYLKAYQEN